MPWRAILIGILAGTWLAGCDAALLEEGDAAPGVRGFLAGFDQPQAVPREGGDGLTRPRLPTPLARTALAGDDVVVAGPDGYCIDPTTRQSSAERGFAMIASCEILSGGRMGSAVSPILVTVSVGPNAMRGDLPDPEAIAQAAGAPLLGGERHEGLVVANLAQGGDAVLTGRDGRYWRGAFVQSGHLVGLALYAPKGSPFSGPEGQVMLEAVRARIARLSAGSEADGSGGGS